MSYLTKLTTIFEDKIIDILPKTTAPVIEGWSEGSTHYLAVYASFLSNNEYGHRTRLLTILPLENDATLSAQEHRNFLSFILDLYELSWDNVVAIIGDNVSTNKFLSNITNIPLIGCASNRFNLAVCGMKKKIS